MVTITLAIIIAIGVFATLWWYVTVDAIRVWQRSPLTFTPIDSQGNLVPFEPRHERYMKVAEVVTTLAAASLVFIPSSRLSIYTHSCAFALVLLGFCVLYCIWFMAALIYFYEGFLYNNKSYVAWKYGLVHALGFGGLFCFALAYIFLALRIGSAVIYTLAPAAQH